MSKCLDLNAGTLILELKQAEEVRHRNTAASPDVEEQAAGELAIGEMEEDEEEAPKHRRNGKAVRADNDFSDLLPVSGVSHIVPLMLLNLSIHTADVSLHDL